ncbi:MAG: right-handed parallel beta-helix repeat-containing protein [Myxococcales bacterium]
MRRALLALFTLVFAACPSFEVPKDTKLTCENGADCPDHWVCVQGHCRRTDQPIPETPRIAVSFVHPKDGAEDVSLRPEITVAFDFAVKPASLVGAVSLTPLSDAGGEPLVLTAEATELPNVFDFKVGRPLAELTSYRLTVKAGLEALDPGQADPMAADFASAFTTGFAPDLTAPEVVLQDLIVDVRSDTEARLTWTAVGAPDAGLAGVLVVRRQGGPVPRDAKPARQNYAIGARLGDTGEAEVIASTMGSDWIDATRVAGESYGYALFAFDEASNYTAGFRPPYLGTTTLTWCPDQQGTFVAEGSGATEDLLYVLDDPDEPAKDDPTGSLLGLHPLGEAVPLQTSDAGLRAGHRYKVRAVVESDTGKSLGRVERFWASPSHLLPTAPATISPGKDVVVGFEAQGWRRFEAQLDVNAAADAPDGGLAVTWGTSCFFDAPQAPPVRLAVAQAGAFHVRVRPVVDGCASLAWDERDLTGEFKTGNVLYVSPLGDDGNDGKTAAAPLKTIDAALGLIRGGVFPEGRIDVLVAEGDYPEQLVVTAKTRLLGGYASDFLVRDRKAHPSRISPRYTGKPAEIYDNSFAAILLVDVDESTVVDGFYVEPQGELVGYEKQGIRVGGSARAIIRNNAIDPGANAGPTVGIMVWGGEPTVEDNDIDDGQSTAADSVGVGVQNAQAVIRGNRFTAKNAVTVMDAGAKIEGNTIRMKPVDGVRGLYLLRSTTGIEVLGNTFEPTGTALGTTHAIEITADSLVHVEGNRVHGGIASRTAAFYIADAVAGVRILNNLVNAGQGGAGYHVAFEFNCWYCSGGIARATIASNTVFAGDPVGTGVVLYDWNAAPVFVDNLLFGEGSWIGVLTLADPPPASFEHNVFLTAKPPFAFATTNKDVAAPELEASMGQLCAGGGAVAGNAQTAAPWDDVFVTPFPGAGGGRGTFDGTDWQLEPGAPAAARSGGKDASGATCGGTGSYSAPVCTVSGNDVSCGGVVGDFTGKKRVGAWSVGAYQP